jgi:molybdopterin converting factor small subunit
MLVQVKLFFHLRKYQDKDVELANGSDATDLIRHLRIPLEEVGVLSINNRMATLDQQLKAGDIITIIPPIGGG